jgi:hypothetical protein
MIIVLKDRATDNDIKRASEEYTHYIKITIDLDKEMVAIGGEYHFDAEKELLKLGSKQESIWGGGLNLTTKNLETNAMINVRAGINPHQEIQNQEIKSKFLQIAYKYVDKYANKI